METETIIDEMSQDIEFGLFAQDAMDQLSTMKAVRIMWAKHRATRAQNKLVRLAAKYNFDLNGWKTLENEEEVC